VENLTGPKNPEIHRLGIDYVLILKQQ